MLNYLYCIVKSWKSEFLVQKKPVASDERIIPWNIDVANELICLVTNVNIPRFSQHLKSEV